MRFDLHNYGANPPRIIGSGTIVPSYIDLVPDNTGLVTGTIIGNDIISPMNTYYHMIYFVNGSRTYTCDLVISGASMNLDGASCMTQAAPAPMPFNQCIQCTGISSGPLGAVQLSDGMGGFINDDSYLHHNSTTHLLGIGTNVLTNVNSYYRAYIKGGILINAEPSPIDGGAFNPFSVVEHGLEIAANGGQFGVGPQLSLRQQFNGSQSAVCAVNFFQSINSSTPDFQILSCTAHSSVPTPNSLRVMAGGTNAINVDTLGNVTFKGGVFPISGAGSVSRTNSTINDGAPVNLVTSALAGPYSLDGYALCRTVGAGTSIAVALSYTDNSGIQTYNMIPSFACDAGGHPHSTVITNLYATAGSNITFQTTDVGGASYDLYIVATKLF